jgi:hypothetical protein
MLMGNMNPLRAEIPRQHVRQAAQGKLRRAECCRCREWFHAGGRASEEDRAFVSGRISGTTRCAHTGSRT